MDDVIKEFLIEAYENLDHLDRDLVSLEEQPESKESLSSIFRTLHTIKGSGGYLGFSKLQSIAHAGEDLLSTIRSQKIKVDSNKITALLAAVDAVREILSNIEARQEEGEEDYSELILSLQRLQDVKNETSDIETNQAKQEKAKPEIDDSQRSSSAELTDKGLAESNIRVGVKLVDGLMDLAGELVIARNQLMQYATRLDDFHLLATSQRLSLITTEMQQGLMKTRMQPISTIWEKYPRLVRDIALKEKKKIKLLMKGEETELDRTMVEAINDPLTHLIRNAIDHGIQTPSDRQAANQSETGHITITAYHEGGHIIIEVSDDGKGIDVNKVKQKALELGMMTPQQSLRLSDHEAINLIFRPGISTAKKVTSLSGRGVGMDVVRVNIEKIGGMVNVQSTLGIGTVFRLKIPLTLAIIPALITVCGNERYAIPQASLLELIRIEEHQEARIEIFHSIPVYRLRGKLLPLVFLHKTLNVAPRKKADRSEYSTTLSNIVVLKAGERQFGLVVDDIKDTEEIVVKPLWKKLKQLSVYSGATIMGDGRIALILDIVTIAQMAHVISEEGGQMSPLVSHGDVVKNQQQILLILEAQAGQRLAVPLSKVARLEKFSRSDIEQSGTQNVIQYRGEILPLFHIPYSDALNDQSSNPPTQEPEMVHVVVYMDHGTSVGFIVGNIVDIIEQEIKIQHPADRAYIRGTAIIQDKATDLLDFEAMLHDLYPSFFEQQGQQLIGESE